MRWSALALFLAAIGCATVSAPDPTSTYPDVASVPAPVEAPVVVPEIAPTSVPVPGPCDAAPALDPRCPADILVAAAMSYLDKTVAEFDGTTLRVIEYDRDALLTEALADPGFRRLLHLADTTPSDGLLDHPESRTLESTVLRLCESRIARR